ncbi:MAG: Flp pilus assembly complex ATPase component [Deltaproteobacteria bacterium]|nr:Flp pilus assembly complex ATPase component [Deltaproteobacteria bacterium]
MSLKPKEVIAGFSAAHFRIQGELRHFVSDVGVQPASVIEKLLLRTLESSKEGDADRLQKQLLALEGILDASLEPALFSTMVGAVEHADLALLQILVPRISRANNPSQHGVLVQLFSSNNKDIRAFASSTLLVLGAGTEAFEALVELVKDQKCPGRSEALELLAEIGGTRALPAIVAVLKIGRVDDRVKAIELLGRPEFIENNIRGVLESLKSVFADHSDRVVEHAIDVYSRHCSDEDLSLFLLPGLDSPRLLVVTAIIRAMARFPSPTVLSRLEQCFARGPLAARVAVMDTCEVIGDERVAPHIFDALSSPQISVRNRAGEILTRLGQKQRIDVTRTILWLMRNSDPNVRRRAVEVAAESPDVNGELWPQLFPYLSDNDWWVRERMVDVLVAHGGEKCLPEVTRILADGSPIACIYALDILEQIDTSEAQEQVINAAHEASEMMVRDRAIEALSRMTVTQDGVMTTVKLMEEVPELCIPCVHALREMGAKEAAGDVANLLTRYDATLVPAILTCLDVLDDPEQSVAVERLLADPMPRNRQRAEELLLRWSSYRGTQSIEEGKEKSLLSLESLLIAAAELGADALLLASGAKPLAKHQGEATHLMQTRLSSEHVEQLVHTLLTTKQRLGLERGKDVETSYSLRDGAVRYRVNVFPQAAGLTAVFERAKTQLVPFMHLGLPDLTQKCSRWRNGLVILCGEPRSGRSTTLNALIDFLNEHHRRHVITLSATIEVMHSPKRSLVSQRELGAHADALDAALKATLRQDPDVICLDDISDGEALEFALSAAETGHLVICTLPARSVTNAIERILQTIGESQRLHLLQKLASSLRAVLFQKLLPRKDQPGKIAAAELLLNTPAMANVLRKGKTNQLQSVISTSSGGGMIALDADLERLARAGIIDKA